MISLSSAINVVVMLIVAGLIFGLLWWLVDYCGIPEPFHKVAKVVLAVLAVLVVIGILLSLVSGTPVFRASGHEKEARVSQNYPQQNSTRFSQRNT